MFPLFRVPNFRRTDGSVRAISRRRDVQRDFVRTESSFVIPASGFRFEENFDRRVRREFGKSAPAPSRPAGRPIAKLLICCMHCVVKPAREKILRQRALPPDIYELACARLYKIPVSRTRANCIFLLSASADPCNPRKACTRVCVSVDVCVRESNPRIDELPRTFIAFFDGHARGGKEVLRHRSCKL